MNEIDIRKAAKKIQSAQTFQELHDIMVAYANSGDYIYKSQNKSAEVEYFRVFMETSGDQLLSSFVYGERK